jgi:hypothetical protein
MTDRLNGTDAGPGLRDVDQLLRDFYRSEMPDPWPALRLPNRAPARHTPPRFARSLFRLALAASVVLGLLAFWSVAGLFPKDGTPGGPTGPELMQKPGHRVPEKHLSPVEHIRTPGGIDAQLFEEGLPNGGQVINIQIIGPSSSTSPR